MAELNELISELDKSVHCYTPRNPDFAFAVPLPKILKLLAAEARALAVIITDLSEKMKEIDALRATWRENFKAEASID